MVDSEQKIRIPNHCIIAAETIFEPDGSSKQILRAKPNLQAGIITVKKLGGMTEVNLHCIGVDKGVNTHDIHEFNLISGFLSQDDETAEERKSESKRVSESRLRSTIREYAACNPWDYFVTITLNPLWWDRENPESLQTEIMNDFRRWSRMQVRKVRPYQDCAYLFVPELHEQGGVHLHGMIHQVPVCELVPYTMDDVNSEIPLPRYICDEVAHGKEIYHLRLWDSKYGYNTLTRIRDQDRAANYITKYISKSFDAAIFKTRVWHARGLQRAATVARFRLPPGEEELDAYREYVHAIAAVTSNGVTLQQEYCRPGKDSIAGINTMVNGDTMTALNVAAYLSLRYPSVEYDEK